LNTTHVIVIGAGIGGLVAALDLARRGLRVSVYERCPVPGGKMREIDIQDHRIDAGPTVFTMPWIFESLFADAGSSLADHLSIRPAEVLARHAWQRGGRLDLFADGERSAAAIEAFAGPAEAQRYRDFSAHAKQVFETLYGPYIQNPKPSPWSLVGDSGLRGLLKLWRIHPFETLWRRLGKYFHDPRLRGLFARYATYCGSSPLKAPATLMLIAHVERMGVWQIDGGMHSLARALSGLIEEHGGTVHCDAGVREIAIESGRVTGIGLDSGERIRGDIVIANADAASLQRGDLGRAAAAALRRPRRGDRTLSAVTWSMLADTSGFELSHHNVFFPDDYPKEFTEIFRHQRLPVRPAVYVCAQDRSPGSGRPEGPERLFMIANAPANGDRQAIDPDTRARLEGAVFGLLEDCGLTVRSAPEQVVMTTPSDFESMFPSTGGALYGAVSHGWRASFSRPTARSRTRGLYLAGGGIHPGSGVPMVAISGRLAAQSVAEDLGLN
jgi:1-hydroxycarotenoid 3,4-desaturase